MKTIDIILKEAGYTKAYLIECELKKICNGMGAKGGIQWTDRMRKMKSFKGAEEQELLTDLDYVSDIHDLECNKGGSIFDFLKANYNLTIRILQLLHWTSILGRLLIFVLCFFGTSTVGIKSFNFHKQTLHLRGFMIYLIQYH